MFAMEAKIKQRVLHRTKIAEGQFRALVRAIEADDYCIDIITQSLAIQNSLKSLNAAVLENHLKQHVGHQLSKPSSKTKAIVELIRIYVLSRK